MEFLKLYTSGFWTWLGMEWGAIVLAIIITIAFVKMAKYSKKKNEKES